MAEHEELQSAAAACEVRTQALLEEAGTAAAKHATLDAALKGTKGAQAESQARRAAPRVPSSRALLSPPHPLPRPPPASPCHC